MRWVLRILGILCVIASFLCLGDTRLFPSRWGEGLFILGFLFFCLARLFGCVANLDRLLKPSSTVDLNRIRTDMHALERPGNVEGQATCAGCGKLVPKRDLCFSQSLDAYYHRECLARDLSWSDPSRSSKAS